ncbi:SurA N-terminal domain-containing protein [Spelaeicoccus albus]|uniref:peptidylprolyl isomerase n=1 Tax=Spelaeicoccus albus TaxID=1280376 RepID=A0A7Z0CZV1_9MICO|nr:SurA N-terminal domain-containing protein [Spelaeicoccus albus]NYI66624.1 DNA polymerase III alpha subunit (gram-positive type) [Spelaeicoccus albus]
MIRKVITLLIAGFVALGAAACDTQGTSSGGSGGSGGSDKASASGQSDAASGQSGIQGKVKGSKTVATVNGEDIKGIDYNGMLQQLQTQAQQQSQQQGQQAAPMKGAALKQVKKQAIKALVSNQLILQDADKRGIEPSKDKVQKQIDATKKQYKTKKKLDAALKSSNMTMKQFRSRTTDQVQVQAYEKKVIGPIHVSDAQVKKYYQQYAAQAKAQQAQQAQQGQQAQSSQVPPLKKVKPQIKQQLQQQKQQQELSKIVKKLKAKANVKVFV